MSGTTFTLAAPVQHVVDDLTRQIMLSGPSGDGHAVAVELNENFLARFELFHFLTCRKIKVGLGFCVIVDAKALFVKRCAMQLHLEERIKEAMTLKCQSIKEFSELTGIPYPSLREYLAGKKKPGFDALASIVGATEVSADWLLTGEGSKLRGQLGASEPDTDMLAQIVEGVELLLKKTRRELSPEKKARVIVMLYRSFAANHQVDLAIIREMIELAA